jgi:hypothetical protein
MGKKPSPATVPLKVLKCKIFNSSEFHDFLYEDSMGGQLWGKNKFLKINI